MGLQRAAIALATALLAVIVSCTPAPEEGELALGVDGAGEAVVHITLCAAGERVNRVVINDADHPPTQGDGNLGPLVWEIVRHGPGDDLVAASAGEEMLVTVGVVPPGFRQTGDSAFEELPEGRLTLAVLTSEAVSSMYFEADQLGGDDLLIDEDVTDHDGYLGRARAVCRARRSSSPRGGD